MSASIKKNFLYNSIITTAHYIFPFITYPYVSRVLGVTNIGLCNFVDSIIFYFILFSTFGISAVGTREVARCKGNVHALRRTFSSLFAFNAITTLIAVITLAIATMVVPKLHEHWEMMLVGGIRLVFNFLLIEWFFRGMEDFRFITLRTIAVRILYIIMIFVFIHDADDYFKFYVISMLVVAINAIINFLYSRRLTSFSIKEIDTSPFIKSLLILGIYNIVTSMYTSFNVAFLGFTSGETEVGYYTTATKLYSIILSIFTALTSVMLPRQSALLSEGKFEEYKVMLNKTTNILFLLFVPIVFYCIIYAPDIIHLISGSGYEGAILPMRIVMPLMIICGYEQILVIQGLMPLKKDKAVFRNSIIGCFVGLALNITIVPYLNSMGSAIVWLCSEIAVLISAQYYMTKYVQICFPYKYLLSQILYNIPLLFFLFVIYKEIKVQSIIILLISGFVMCIYFIFFNTKIIKNAFVINTLKQIKDRSLNNGSSSK